MTDLPPIPEGYDENDPEQRAVEHVLVMMAADDPKQFAVVCHRMGVVNRDAFLRNLQAVVKRRMS